MLLSHHDDMYSNNTVVGGVGEVCCAVFVMLEFVMWVLGSLGVVGVVG